MATHGLSRKIERMATLCLSRKTTRMATTESPGGRRAGDIREEEDR